MTCTLADPGMIVQEAVKKVTAIATLPEVTARIVATVEDPKSSAAQLHRIVAHDPALVTRILKVVNSAFYGLPGQIASIDRAIVLLGLNAIKNIAVAASLGQLFRGVKLCNGFTAKDLWSHCIAVAVASRELAREMKLPVVEEAFLAGMIHDIGLLVALQVWPEKLQQTCEKALAGGDFCQIERDTCGVDHQQLGQGMTELWKFPRACQLVAANHHNPSVLPADQRSLTAIVYVADTMCSQRKIGFNLTALSQQVTAQDLEPLPINPSVLERVGAGLDEKIKSAAAMLA
jgi:putative nucleotidyltransferase with HDIG domain